MDQQWMHHGWMDGWMEGSSTRWNRPPTLTRARATERPAPWTTVTPRRWCLSIASCRPPKKLHAIVVIPHLSISAGDRFSTPWQKKPFLEI